MKYKAQYKINTDRITAKDRAKIAQQEIAVQIGMEIVKNIPLEVEPIQEGHFYDELHTVQIHVYTEAAFQEILDELKDMARLGYLPKLAAESIYKKLSQ